MIRHMRREERVADICQMFPAHSRGEIVEAIDAILRHTNNHDAMRHALHQLVDMRQGNNRLTIITGNESRDKVRAWLDPRTLERIEHQGGIVECKGDNLRRKGAA